MRCEAADNAIANRVRRKNYRATPSLTIVHGTFRDSRKSAWKKPGDAVFYPEMLRNKKVIVVMPAYNAAKTLERTHAEVLEQEIVDEVIVVDDASHDETIAIARTLPRTTVHVHPQNLGY